MSMHAYASLTLGLRLPRKAALVPHESFNCRHQYQGPGNFCPECGSRAGKRTSFQEPDWLRDLVRNMNERRPCEFAAVNEGQDGYVIGKVIVESYDATAGAQRLPLPIQDDAVLWSAVLTLLEQHGIDGTQYEWGLWLTSYYD